MMDTLYNSEQERGSKRYLVRLILIGVTTVITGIAVFYFFVLPKHGDQVTISSELRDEIRAYFNNEGDTIESMTAFQCDYFIINEKVSNKSGIEVVVRLAAPKRGFNRDLAPSEFLETSRNQKVWIRNPPTEQELSAHTNLLNSPVCVW